MNFTNEQANAFGEPSAEKIALKFNREFPKIIQNDNFLEFHMSSLNLIAQHVLNATDVQSLKTSGAIEESQPVVGSPITTLETVMEIDDAGQLKDFKPVIREEHSVQQRVSTHSTFTIGGETQSQSDEPWPIPIHDALSYLAFPDTPSIIKNTFNLPPLDRDISGFRAFLITQLCEYDERVSAWANTEHGNKDLRKILLDAAVMDKAIIERYKFRRTDLKIKDDHPITRCVTDANFAQVLDLLNKLISDLTVREIPSPDAPTPSS